MQEKRKVFIILDANALIHRSFHALPDFRTTRGELVNAVYGFSSIFLRVLREFQPEYIAAAFDVAGPTFRDEEFAEYKAKRPKAPDELYAQIPFVKKVLEAFHVPIYEKQGFEADDVIGTVAKLIQKKQAHPKVETVIVSGDLDTLQLVDENTKVYTMRKGLQDTVLYGIDAVKKRFDGVTPEQMADYKGLRGDPSDNIPGVTGVGEKTAIQLLNEFGSLDCMYKELEENTAKAKKMKPKLREKLVQYKDQALFSRELATICRDVPIDFKIEDLAWRDFDRTAVEKVFREFGFRSLLARLPEVTPTRSLRIPSLPPHGAPDATYEKIESLYRDGVLSKEVYELERKLVPVVRAMEKTGIKIDKQYFAKLGSEISAELSGVEEDIHKSAMPTGRQARKHFNINSPQQLSEVLFAPLPEGLGISIKGLKKTPGGVVSTAASELEKLSEKHPVINLLLQYRELQKLFSTYLKPLPEMADQNGRIHTTFDQLGTATGRISSSEPNLQNIPVKGEWGTKIRKGFIADAGFQFVALDYSQMELRIIAHAAQDEKMKAGFFRGEDIHRITAAEVFGIEPQNITKEMRDRAKALNFGIIYGMGAAGFARSAGISRADAESFIENYFLRFPAIQGYMERTKEFGRKNGYVETLLGRKRYLPEMSSTHPPLRAQAERMAINHPIQGTAADIIKMVMVKIYETISNKQSAIKMLLQVHDELLFEIRDDKIEEAVPQIQNIMEHIYTLTVPLKADASAGPSWGELKTWPFTQQ